VSDKLLLHLFLLEHPLEVPSEGIEIFRQGLVKKISSERGNRKKETDKHSHSEQFLKLTFAQKKKAIQVVLKTIDEKLFGKEEVAEKEQMSSVEEEDSN